MEIKLETTLPVFKDDPNSFLRPMIVTVYDFDDQGTEYLIGQLKGDVLHFSKAEDAGHRLIDVFDCDVWEEVYRDLIDKAGNWRAELNLELPVLELVVFYRVALAPCTTPALKHILHAVFNYFSCYTLIGLWDMTQEISPSDLVALGFARLSHSKMVLRHAGMSCPFSREEEANHIPMMEATDEDQQWVRSRCD